MSKTISVAVMVRENVMKLSHGQPPTANAAMLMHIASKKSAGICTRDVEAAYDQALYMPARISYTTEKLSLLVPMRVEMLMHAGNARTHHR